MFYNIKIGALLKVELCAKPGGVIKDRKSVDEVPLLVDECDGKYFG